MIKVIAFDLVGVLVNEKDIELSVEEDKLERTFGKNLNDSDYIISARKIIDKDSTIIEITESLIEKLYNVKDRDIFNKVKKIYPEAKIVIATNHVSFVRNFIGESFDIEYLDDLIISAEIHKAKPDKEFYTYILDKFKINPEELLFIDDNKENTLSASEMKIKTINVQKDTDIIEKITEFKNI